MPEFPLGCEFVLSELVLANFISPPAAPSIYKPIFKIEKYDTITQQATDITSLCKSFSVEFSKSNLATFSMDIAQPQSNNVRTSNILNLASTTRIDIKIGYIVDGQKYYVPLMRGIIAQEPEIYENDNQMTIEGNCIGWLLEDTNGTVTQQDSDFPAFSDTSIGSAKYYIKQILNRAGITDYALNFIDYNGFELTKETTERLIEWLLIEPGVEIVPYLVTRRVYVPVGNPNVGYWYEYQTRHYIYNAIIFTNQYSTIQQTITGETTYFDIRFNFANMRQALDMILSVSPYAIYWYVTGDGIFVIRSHDPNKLTALADFTYTEKQLLSLNRSIERLATFRIASQPVNITGVVINQGSAENGIGIGTLFFNSANKILSWSAPNDTIGPNVPINDSAAYKLYSNDGLKFLEVVVNQDKLPSTNQQDSITLRNYAESLSFSIKYNPGIGLDSKIRIIEARSNTDVHVFIRSFSVSANPADGDLVQKCVGVIID